MVVEFSKAVALLLALCLIQGFIARRWTNKELLGQISSGLLFGGICVIGMLTPIVVAPGVIFDARSVVLSMSGLFGGPVVGGIAAVIAGGYRAWLGGGGAAVGVSVVISCVLLGLAYRHCHQRGWIRIGFFQLLAFGLLVHLVEISLFTFLPDDVVEKVMKEIALPLVLTFTPATALLGSLLQMIESQIQTEKSLVESENLLNSIFENVPVGLLIKGPDHVVERPNPTYQNWYGLQAEKMLGRRSDQVEDFQSTEDAELMNAHERKVLTTGRTQTRQVDRPFADGRIHTVNITKFPVYDRQGNITKVGSVSVDLTDLKKGERELKDAQEKLENIISNLPGGIYRRILRTDGTESLDYNMGQIPRELGVETKIGASSSKFVSEFILPEYREIRDEAVRRSAATMEPCIFEYPVRMPDGSTRWIQSVSVPHLRENGEIVWDGLNLDITDRVKADEERRLARTQAEQANQAKSEFLASMSHDLRTPLNAVLGYADLLSEQYLGPLGNEKYKEYAGNIRASGEHLLMLVNEILDLSTLEAGRQSVTKEKLITEEVVKDCVKTVAEDALFNGIDLVTKVAENLPSLYADKRAVKKILLNLLSNSLKFTPKGGKVTVSAKASKRNTTLSVADTGKGIPAEKLPRLTEPFTKGESDPYLSEDGWGLGLAIVKSLVDLHGGTLDIKSKVGKGTTVTVTLPNGAP